MASVLPCSRAAEGDAVPTHEAVYSNSAVAGGWTEPGTAQAYPFAYEAYRRLRETEEKPLPRHQFLGCEADRHVWRVWRVRPNARVDVLLKLRHNASPRIRRIVAAILASIRRGHSPDEAIRLTAKRFGLRSARVRTCLATHVNFDLKREDLAPWAPVAATSLYPLGEWL